MNDAIKAAVAWWRDTLKHAKQEMTDATGSSWKTISRPIQPMLTDEQLDAFAAELESGLRTVMMSPEPFPPEALLHVEYCPQGLLYAAAHKGKFGAMYFPNQTTMRVRPNQVDVTRSGNRVIWCSTQSKTT